MTDLQSRALGIGVGTQALGNIDNHQDGERTKRRRRKVIVLRQKRGTSLDLTLQESKELSNLGMKFEKWQITSPVTSTQSSKGKKIILRRIDRPGEDSLVDDFDCGKSRASKKRNPEEELARSIMKKRQDARNLRISPSQISQSQSS